MPSVPELPTESANVIALYVVEEVAVRRGEDFGLGSEGDCVRPSTSYVERARAEVVAFKIESGGLRGDKGREEADGGGKRNELSLHYGKNEDVRIIFVR